MNVFKRSVLRKYIKDLGSEVIVFVGDRFSDSSRRSKLLGKRGIIEYNRLWKQYTVHPIAHWSEELIYRYLDLNDIELNPLYRKLGFSGNCVYCPYITSLSYYSRLKRLYPKWYKKIVCTEKYMRKGGALLIANKVCRLSDILGDIEC